ncbi:Transducin beta-like protein 2 [Homalodisca vitripennis]|nr:Transducin beta-like protein 2 [Homalodisca vitripennis]
MCNKQLSLLTRVDNRGESRIVHSQWLGLISLTNQTSVPGSITRVLFDSAGDHVLTAGEKHVRVFHNVTGRRTAIASARLRLSMANNSAATKERLEGIISTAETFLKSLKEPLVTKAK